jgi:glycosidase
VAVQDRDTTSLLNLYRRLIHARETNSALRSGTLLPLESGNEGVVAYVRQDSAHAALVIANLGSTPVDGVTLSSTEPVAEPRRYAMRNLLNGPSAQPLVIGADGKIAGYLPLPVLAPREAYVFELVR